MPENLYIVPAGAVALTRHREPTEECSSGMSAFTGAYEVTEYISPLASKLGSVVL